MNGGYVNLCMFDQDTGCARWEEFVQNTIHPFGQIKVTFVDSINTINRTISIVWWCLSNIAICANAVHLCCWRVETRQYKFICARDWSAVCLVFIINLLNTIDRRTKTLHTSNASNTVYIWTVEVYKRKNKWLFRDKRQDNVQNRTHLLRRSQVCDIDWTLVFSSHQTAGHMLLYAFNECVAERMIDSKCRSLRADERYRLRRKRKTGKKNSVRFYPVIDRLSYFNLFYV